MENSFSKLEWLIAPLTVEDFLDKYWEQQATFIQRNDGGYWSSLLSVENIDEVIGTQVMKYGQLKMANARGDVAPVEYTSEEELINVTRVYKLFNEGCTIILNQLQRRLLPLSKLCNALEHEFSIRFQTNIYVTPPGAQGFEPHYDGHGVFVLQISGSKNWRIYHRPIYNPLESQKEPFELGSPNMEFTLYPGDVAYIPSGVVHEAMTNDEMSIHITLGAMAQSWGELLGEMLAQTTLVDANFRSSLPLGFANSGFNVRDAHATVVKLLDSLRAPEISNKAFDSIINKFISQRRPILDKQLLQCKSYLDFPSNAQFQVRPNLVYKIIEGDESIKIHCYGNDIVFPVMYSATVRYMLMAEKFYLNDLPSELDYELKMVILMKLINEGIVMAISE